MSVKQSDIKLGEVLSEFESLLNANRPDQEHIEPTTEELTDLWGVCQHTVRQRLRPLIRSGMVEAFRTQGKNWVGHLCWNTRYRLTAAGREKINDLSNVQTG